MRVAGGAGFGQRAGLLRRAGFSRWLRRVRRIGAGAGMLALAVPLAWPSGTGGQQLSVPSAGSVRSGLVRLADFVTGDAPPALVVPVQQAGTGSLKPHIVPASASRNVTHATGHAPGKGTGQLPPWQAHGPAGAPGGTWTSGPALTGFNAATSTQVASGTTATSDLFKNADGSYTRDIYAAPVNYQMPSGSWAPISETLAQGAGGRWQETANSPAASFAAAGDDTALGTLANADGSESVSLSLAGAGNVAGVASGPSVTYPGILPGTGLTQTATATGIGESMTLSAAGAPASWVFPLALKGLTATLDRGSVDLADSAGTVVYVIGPATVWSGADAAAPGSRDTSQPAWKLGTDNGGPALELALDASWLGAPGRVLPITVGWPVTAPAAAGSTYAESVNGAAETADNSGSALLPSGTVTNSTGTYRDTDFLSFPPLGGLPKGEHVAAASLNLFDAYAAQCSAAGSVSAYQVTGTRPGRGPLTYPGPAYGTQAAQWTGTAPPAACANTSGNPGQGGWISLKFSQPGLAMLNSGTSQPTELAVTPSQSDAQAFKEFDSANATSAASAPASASTAPAANAPSLMVTMTTGSPPQINSQYPPDNYNSPTLTPELMATGQDYNSTTLQYNFTVYSTAGTVLAKVTGNTTGDWTVPSGDLSWGQSYYWTVQAYDGTNYSATPPAYFFSTPVPQPLVTSSLSQNGAGPGFDPQIGDWTTSATDADVTTVGPALEITRDYNSEDPRIGGAFGAGWSSVLDMKVSPGQASGSGTTATQAVTYPDGEDVGFGLIGGSPATYASPPGRYSTLTTVSGGFTLTDKNDTVYTFTQPLGSGVYGITSITDALEHTETFGYNAGSQITTITSASGRKLTVIWASPSGAAYQHVASVVTDDATAGNSSTAQDWTYTYSGDELATACPPSSATACTAYSYTNGSDYPQAVLDSGPQSYWRLDETSGSTAASSVLLNEHTDDATYSGVTFGSVSGPLAGSAATSAGFNGASSYVQVPAGGAVGLRLGAAYQTVSVWFKSVYPNEVLYSYSAAALSAGSTTANYVPALYIGSDGKLNAEVWTGTAAPITTSAAVDDGNWHNAVLTVAGNTQTLYLDGAAVGSPLSGTVKVLDLANHYAGTGFIGGPWPDEPHNGSAAVPEYFTGHMSDVASWTRPLTAAEVQALYAAGTHPAALVTQVTRPSGSVYAQVSYDPLSGRVTGVTDANDGTWQLHPPSVSGSSQVWVASVLGAHPKDYWRLNDTSASEAVNLMNCSCDAAATYYNVTEGVTGGPFADSTVASFNGTSSYLDMPNADENTTGPGSIGLWFKTTGSSEVLYSEQSAAVSSGATSPSFAPVLYVGKDGKLVGQFWIGKISSVAYSKGTVNDGKWHYAVLAAGTSSQTLYLDGVAQATVAGTLSGAAQPYVAAGAGYLGGSWPDTSSSTVAVRWFTGDIAELAWYPAQLTAAQVTAQFDTSRYASGLIPVQTETVTDPGSNTLTSTYDLLNGGRVLTQSDANGYVTSYGYDTGGFQDETTLAGSYVTETGYDVRGNMVSRTTCQDQAANQCSTAYWTYYPNDTSATLSADPRNDMMLTYADGRSASASDTTYRTTYAYNAAGDLTSETTPPVTGFPSGRTTSYLYTDGSTTAGGYGGTVVPPKGLPYQETTPGGAVTTTQYYADGDVAQVTDPDGLRTVYGYDGLGRKTSQTAYFGNYLQNGLTTSYGYDADGRLVTQTDPAVTDQVTGDPHTAQTTTGYDADGNVTSQTVADLTGQDASRTVTRTYNSYDELASETDAAGAKTSYTYDPFGNIASKTDPDGNVTDYAYDGDGHLTATTLENYTGPRAAPPCQPASGPLTEQARSYNPAGWLASVTDAMCNQTDYGYTDNGLVSSIGVYDPADPTGNTSFGTDWYAYDGAGNVTEHWTNDGYTDTSYTIDAAGRITGQELNSGLYRTTAITYTPDDQQASVTQTGPDGVTGQTSYTYDPAGNMLSQTVTDPGAGGPAAWFPLTQTSGTSVPDSAAGGQPATAAGVTWSGSAAQFAGTAGQQVATAGPVTDTTGSFTVAGWVNLTGNTSSDQAVAAQAAGSASGFYLKYDAGTGDWEFTRPLSDAASPSGWATASSASAAATGTWTFLTGTYDANTGTVTLYVNGTQSGSAATDTSPIPAHGPLLIGADKAAGAAADFLDGRVADVQVYPRALSAAEVSTLYGLGQGGSDVTTGKLVTTWTRDQRGLPVSMTDPDGQVTGYTYDEAGQLAVTTGPTVTTETYDNGTPVTVTAHPLTETGYDTFGDVSETKDADGNVTTYGYDADGRQVTETMPSYTPPGGSPVTSVYTTGYDGDGNVTSASDGIGNTTKYTYDQLGDQVTATAPDGSVTTTVYDADRQPLSVTGPTGAQTQTTWDYLGRKESSTQIERDTGSGTAAYTTTYSYADSNSGGGFLSQVTSPDQVSTGYAYDPAGELAQVTDGAGNVTSYAYDSLGRQVQVTRPDGTSTVTGYDGAGNPTSVQQLDASGATLTTTSATFDGEGDKLSATDAGGNATTFTYDPTGLVSQEVQPVSAASGITTSFGYDAAGNQTRYTDGNGNSWQYTYNSWGLQQSRVEPATSQYSSPADSTYQTAYDGDGSPATVTEPGGVTVTDSYNKLEELTGQSGAGADAATPTRSFGYDQAGNLTSAATSGSGATSESFTYNDRGQVLTASGTAGATSYGYNGDGQVTSVADAAGTTSYTYDTAGRLATLADPASGSTATYSYNDNDQVSGISYGSGADTQSLGYDSLHRLTSDTLKTGSGTTVASVSYGYDPDGQITSQATTGLAGPSSSTYSYDQAGRLTSWDNGTVTTSYGYDADGNLTQDGAKTYTYDARDELISDGTSSYTYTARGTPASESSPGGSAPVTFDAYGDQATAGPRSYTYDALGRLVSDQPSGSGTGYAFSYAGSTAAIASDGASTYTWDPSGTTLVGTGAAGGESGVLAFTDSHGDVLGQFAPAGTSMSGAQAYDPWGTVTAGGGSLAGLLGFQSAWTDPATGKNLMGARWYDPAAGDFTSADTIQVPPVPDPAAGNPYAYAADDPLDAVDPTGHLCFLGVCTPAVVNRLGHDAAHDFDTARHDVAATVDWGASAGADTVGDELKLIRQAAARVRDVAHTVADAASTGIRKLGSAVARAVTYVRPVVRAVTAPVRAVVHLVNTAVHKATTVARKTVSAVRRAASATAGFVKRHATGIKQVAAAAGAVAFPALAPEALAVDAPFLQQHWRGVLQTALVAGAVGLTIANVLQLGLDPLTDAAEGADVGALAADLGEEAASTAADSAASAAEEGAAADEAGADSGQLVEQGCGESFTAGTKVLLASGLAIPISQLRPGDRVLATNTKTGQTSPEAVTAVMVKRDTDRYDLAIRSGHRTAIIGTTRNHLFWDVTRGRWVKAGALRHGDRLRAPGGAIAAVISGHAPADSAGWMWDISVPGGGDHDFYIDTAVAPVLVHNCPTYYRGARSGEETQLYSEAQ